MTDLATDGVYAYIAEDGGVVAVLSEATIPHSWVPLVSISKETALGMRPLAQELATRTNKTLRLCHFAAREELAVVTPGPRRVTGTASGLRQKMIDEWGFDPTDPLYDPSDVRQKPVTAFDTPIMERVAHASGVVVSPIVAPPPDGRPGLALIFTVDGQVVPPIGLLGQQAEDLPKLATEALAIAHYATGTGPPTRSDPAPASPGS